MSDSQFPGELHLQVCNECNRVNYPDRERCGACLSEALQWRRVSGAGEIQSITRLHHSNEQIFNDHLPLTIVSVQLDCGPVVLAFSQDDALGVGQTVKVGVFSKSNGDRLLVACGQDTDLANTDELENIKSRLGFLGANK